jgi:hypothetical protein
MLPATPTPTALKDKQRFVWFYRDWVIKAINEDKPYSQFVIEQLAAICSRTPRKTSSSPLASSATPWLTKKAASTPNSSAWKPMFDRVDTIGKSILGVTIGCAQCHNHKFDPLTQEEYYKLFAFLNDWPKAASASTPPNSRCSAPTSSGASRKSKTTSNTRIPTGASA